MASIALPNKRNDTSRYIARFFKNSMSTLPTANSGQNGGVVPVEKAGNAGIGPSFHPQAYVHFLTGVSVDLLSLVTHYF
jgi:hypothetical protein